MVARSQAESARGSHKDEGYISSNTSVHLCERGRRGGGSARPWPSSRIKKLPTSSCEEQTAVMQTATHQARQASKQANETLQLNAQPRNMPSESREKGRLDSV